MLTYFEILLDRLLWTAFVGSFALCLLSVGFKKRLVQKHQHQSHWTHNRDVVRLGGLVLVATFVFTHLSLLSFEMSVTASLVLCSIPIFLAGLSEDLGFSITPRSRIFFSFVSSAIAVFVLEIWLQKTGIEALDAWLAIPFFGIVLTVFMTVGLAHSFNLIDGLNGLCSGIGIICLFSLAILSFHTLDHELHESLLVLIGALLAFWVINIYLGNIFLGDGGAYFIGFMIAWLSIYIVNQSLSISPWACLLLSIYPVSETIITMIRRTLAGRNLFEADTGHLHHLFRVSLENRFGLSNDISNSVCTAILLLPNIIVAAIVINYYDHSVICGISAIVFFLGQSLVYRYLRPTMEHPN
jgi:UDP-N-acetylmuramyl pentapeptide phosphotransferase/UDP-N-acetylglucosamine-1-phosphate transferase